MGDKTILSEKSPLNKTIHVLEQTLSRSTAEMLFPFSGLVAHHRTLFNLSLQYEERTYKDGSKAEA